MKNNVFDMAYQLAGKLVDYLFFEEDYNEDYALSLLDNIMYIHQNYTPETDEEKDYAKKSMFLLIEFLKVTDQDVGINYVGEEEEKIDRE